MKIYTYKQPAAIESTEAIQIINEAGEVSSTVQRVYSNALKKHLTARWTIVILFALMSMIATVDHFLRVKKYPVVGAYISEARIWCQAKTI